MSFETALTEEPLPNGTAHRTVPKPQLNSRSTSLMSLPSTGSGETFASQPRDESASEPQGEDTASSTDSRGDSEPEADAQIIEALQSGKDRLFVLKLGESMESLIQERNIRTRIELTPASTYHKLLVHRCAAYYKLTPETEAGSKSIALVVAPQSRIPAKRVSDLVPPDDAPLPAFKIMRRTLLERTRHKPSSQGGSGNDDNANGDMSDGDPSENGSSRGSRRKPLTMSERQAQYDEARSRIFKDLEDKEKKALDMSASSSTLSLLSVSSSSCGAGASSIGENFDETGSDLAVGKDNSDDGRWTGSSRRPNTQPYNGHGHSPGFNYPTLYEPAPTPSTSSSSSYESSPSSGSSVQTPPYQPTLYPVYQYGVPAYLAPFPYQYYPYGHQPPPPHPPPPQHPPDSSGLSTKDNSRSGPADAYPPPMAFVNPYMWAPPPLLPPPPPPPPPLPHQSPHPQSQQSQQQQPHSQHQMELSQPEPQQTQGGPRAAEQAPMHPHYPSFPPHGYPYPPPGPGYLQPVHPPVPYPNHGGAPHVQGPNSDMQRPPNPQINHLHGSTSQPQLFHPGPYETMQAPNGVGGPARTGDVRPPPKRIQVRSGWSFGPGVGGTNVAMAGETVGPRMSMAKRASGGGATNGYNGNNRTTGDETASTASSSTSSSSSRQTFTSNSSKHPLPARPDWAVGLKPQPTLHHSGSHHSSPRSHQGQLPSMSHSHHHSQQRPQLPVHLHSNDFPPLPVSPPNLDKRPVLGGVWAGSTTTRSILGPSPGPPGRLSNGTGLNGGNHVNHSLQDEDRGQQNPRNDGNDRGTERPGPKAGGELFNPDGMGRPGRKSSPNGVVRKVHAVSEKERADKEKTNARGDTVANAILVERVATMRIAPEIGNEQAASNVTGSLTEGTTA